MVGVADSEVSGVDAKVNKADAKVAGADSKAGVNNATASTADNRANTVQGCEHNAIEGANMLRHGERLRHARGALAVRARADHGLHRRWVRGGAQDLSATVSDCASSWNP